MCIGKYKISRCSLSPLWSGGESSDKRQCRTTLPKVIHLSAWYLPSEKHREWERKGVQERKERKRTRDTTRAKEGPVALPTSQSHTRARCGRRRFTDTQWLTYRTRICVFRKIRANSRSNHTVRPWTRVQVFAIRKKKSEINFPRRNTSKEKTSRSISSILVVMWRAFRDKIARILSVPSVRVRACFVISNASYAAWNATACRGVLRADAECAITGGKGKSVLWGFLNMRGRGENGCFDCLKSARFDRSFFFFFFKQA